MKFATNICRSCGCGFFDSPFRYVGLSCLLDLRTLDGGSPLTPHSLRSQRVVGHTLPFHSYWASLWCSGRTCLSVRFSFFSGRSSLYRGQSSYERHTVNSRPQKFEEGRFRFLPPKPSRTQQAISLQWVTPRAKQSTVSKRVGFGELFRSLRTKLAHQLTPVVEISANGRLAFLAFRRKGLRRISQPRRHLCFERSGRGSEPDLEVRFRTLKSLAETLGISA